MAVTLPAYVHQALDDLDQARIAEDASDALKQLDMRDPHAVADQLSKLERDKAATWLRDKPLVLSRAYYEGRRPQVTPEGDILACRHEYRDHEHHLLKDTHRVCEACGDETMKRAVHACDESTWSELTGPAGKMTICNVCGLQKPGSFVLNPSDQSAGGPVDESAASR